MSSGSDINFKKLVSGKLHTHEWTVNWEAQPAPNNHIGRMVLKMTNIIFGVRVHALDFHVIADQVEKWVQL